MLDITNTLTPDSDKEYLFPELTKQEAAFVHWLAMGLQIKEISNVMRVSDSMIKKRAKSSMDKLSVSNTTGLKLLYHCRVEAENRALTLKTHKLLSQVLNLLPHCEE